MIKQVFLSARAQAAARFSADRKKLYLSLKQEPNAARYRRD